MPIRKRIVSISGFLPNRSTSFASRVHHLVCKSSFACMFAKIAALNFSKQSKWPIQNAISLLAQIARNLILILFIRSLHVLIGLKGFQRKLLENQLKGHCVLVYLKVKSK